MDVLQWGVRWAAAQQEPAGTEDNICVYTGTCITQEHGLKHIACSNMLPNLVVIGKGNKILHCLHSIIAPHEIFRGNVSYSLAWLESSLSISCLHT